MKQRIFGIDALRGLVMILMVLDHVRDFYGPTPFDPQDPFQAPASWFFVRWSTHFCAPVFVLLAGTSAWLKAQGLDASEFRRWIFRRGLWLIWLELAVVNPLFMGTMWNIGWYVLVLQVIWVIGVGFLMLGVMSRWPRGLVLAVSVAMIVGHNLLDAFRWSSSTFTQVAWDLLHTGHGYHPLGDLTIGASPVALLIIYPLVPWVGVVGLGWVVGGWLSADAALRRRRALIAGVTLVAAFIALRASGVYGDPALWRWGSGDLSFLACSKYPPSLLFLLMTLGPASLAFAWFDRSRNKVMDILRVFGKVPLFFYLAHLLVINVGAVALALIQDAKVGWWWSPALYPEGYEPSVPHTLCVWVVIVVLLYWPCRQWAIWKAKYPNSLIHWI